MVTLLTPNGRMIGVGQRVRSSREVSALLHALPHATQRVPGYGLNPESGGRVGVAHQQRDLCAPEHRRIHPTPLTLRDDLF